MAGWAVDCNLWLGERGRKRGGNGYLGEGARREILHWSSRAG